MKKQSEEMNLFQMIKKKVTSRYPSTKNAEKYIFSMKTSKNMESMKQKKTKDESFEKWNQFDISFEHEMHHDYVRRAKSIINTYSREVDEALEKENRFTIPTINNFAAGFRFSDVKGHQVQNLIRNCPYFVDQKQQKEVMELILTQNNYIGAIMKFVSDCVSEEYKSDIVFIYCIICQIPPIIQRHTIDQVEQVRFTKHAAVSTEATLSKYMNKIIFKRTKQTEKKLRFAFEKFLKHLASLIVKISLGYGPDSDDSDDKNKPRRELHFDEL